MKHNGKKRIVSFKSSIENQIIGQNNYGDVTILRSEKGYLVKYLEYEDIESFDSKTLEDIPFSLIAELVFFEDLLTPQELEILKSLVFYECNACHRLSPIPILDKKDCWYCNSSPISIDASMAPGYDR